MKTSKLPLQALQGRDIRIWDHVGNPDQWARNSFTYASGEVLANALTRSGAFQVTHLYARYNGPDTVDLSLLNAEGGIKATTRSEFMATASGNGGFYVPLLAPPARDTSDSLLYGLNRLTYYFRIPTVTEEDHGLTGTFDMVNSRVSALGLAVAVDASDRTQDIIISVLQGGNSGGGYAFTMFPLVSGGQKFVDYPVSIAF